MTGTLPASACLRIARIKSLLPDRSKHSEAWVEIDALKEQLGRTNLPVEVLHMIDFLNGN
jgi:hypothetical protein